MKQKIIRLNNQYRDDLIAREVYLARVAVLLRPLDWQDRIQYENLLLA